MSDERTRRLHRASSVGPGTRPAMLADAVRTGELSIEDPLTRLHAEFNKELRYALGLPSSSGIDEALVRDLCSNTEHGLAYDDPIFGCMVYVPDGISVMGSDPDETRWEDETPKMLVHVPAFWIAQRSTSLAQWRAAGGVGGRSIEDGEAVVDVSWNEVQVALHQNAAGASYRVLRGGCWRLDPSYCRSAFRFRLDPGLRYTYLGFRAARSVLPDAGASLRVYCGGSWRYVASICRAAFRYRYEPSYRNWNLGFRVASSVEVPGLRLPTEDQWERAARGWDGRVYPWGDGWISSREERRTKPSPWGVYDMSGEVWGWCQDAWNIGRHGTVT